MDTEVDAREGGPLGFGNMSAPQCSYVVEICIGPHLPSLSSLSVLHWVLLRCRQPSAPMSLFSALLHHYQVPEQ
jgi:hypothetical protein